MTVPYSDAFVSPGEPLGEGFPDNSGAIIYSEKRTESLTEWLALPVALEMLGKEFSRSSDHQDIQFADACKELSELFFQFARVKGA